MKHRLRAALSFGLKHLAVSAAIAVGCAWLVFRIWYPYPYSELASGRDLFALVIGIDVAIGPLLSLIVYDPEKPKRELFRDLGVIFVLQGAALLYGLHSVAQARPVWLAFEGDRFRVVAVPDLSEGDLARAPASIRALSWSGPKPLGVRLLEPSDPEFPKSIQMSMQGIHTAFRPERWVPYDSQRAKVIEVAKPVGELLKKHASREHVITDVIASSGVPLRSVGFLPLASQNRTDWSVLINLQDGQPVGYVPLDAWD